MNKIPKALANEYYRAEENFSKARGELNNKKGELLSFVLENKLYGLLTLSPYWRRSVE